MGGKNPILVFDDADLDLAVRTALEGAFVQTGQRGIASSRLIVTDGIHDRFVAAPDQTMAGLTVGHALDPGTRIGSVADASQLAANLGQIKKCWSKGELLVGCGKLSKRPTTGHYLSPALFTKAANWQAVALEEIVGPIACGIRVRDCDQGLATANKTNLSLRAGVCTAARKHATHSRRKAGAGMVMVNLPTAGLRAQGIKLLPP